MSAPTRTNSFDDDNGLFAPFSDSPVPDSRVSHSLRSPQLAGVASRLHRLEVVVTMFLPGFLPGFLLGVFRG